MPPGVSPTPPSAFTPAAFIIILMLMALHTSSAFFLSPSPSATTPTIHHHRHSSHRQILAMVVSPAIASDIPDKEDVPPSKPVIPLSQLEAVDLRSGTVIKAEYVPDPDHGDKPSRKYLKLVVEVGFHRLDIVSGVRSIADVEDIIGKSVLVAVNTEPEVILGLPSQGKLLFAQHYSKQPMPRTLRDVLLKPGGQPAGSTIKTA